MSRVRLFTTTETAHCGAGFTYFNTYCTGCRRERQYSENVCSQCGGAFRRFYPPYCQPCFERYVYRCSSFNNGYYTGKKPRFDGDWFKWKIGAFDEFEAWLYSDEKCCCKCGAARDEVLTIFNLGDSLSERQWEEFYSQKAAYEAKRLERSWRHRFFMRWILPLLRRLNGLPAKQTPRLPPPKDE